MKFNVYVGAVALATAGMAATVTAQSTLDMPVGQYEPRHVDSGDRANQGRAHEVVFQEVIFAADAAWLRLHFDDATWLEPGSFLRIASTLDGEVQDLDAGSLAMWSNSTAYFNGSAVVLSLYAAPGTTGNRVALDGIELEIGTPIPVGGCGICGADNRIPTDEVFACRLMPVGCSATVYTENSCLVSAGHCMQGGNVAQFHVPASSGNCNTNNPPVAEQFPVIDYEFNNGGVGQDWAVCLTGTNNQGQTCYERYGELRPIAQSGPTVGNAVSIWGYGVDNQCERNQVQQLSTGSVTSVGSVSFNHNADATFGNSGSSIIRSGSIIGIVTHCPCPNTATRIDHPAFASARLSLCPTPVAMGACCFSNGTCGFVSADGCAAIGGVYQGDETDCPSICGDTGTCCMSDGSCFDETTVIVCNVVNGTFHPGVGCADGPCPPALDEACCFGDGTCQDLSAVDCATAGGVSEGTGTDCASLTCPQPGGACCYADGSCEFTSAIDCAATGGAYAGDAVDCASAACPLPCPADIDGDGNVGFTDLTGLLASWGPCPGCPADIDGDGNVGFTDLTSLLASWGPCP